MKKFMMSVSESMFEALGVEVKRRRCVSVQELVRWVLGEALDRVPAELSLLPFCVLIDGFKCGVCGREVPAEYQPSDVSPPKMAVIEKHSLTHVVRGFVCMSHLGWNLSLESQDAEVLQLKDKIEKKARELVQRGL